MKILPLFVTLFILITSSLVGQNDRPYSAGLPGIFPVATFNGPEVGMLNLATRQFRSGQPQEALNTYDAIIGIRPNWLPALVGKSVMLQRLGRQREARNFRQRAERINPIATGFLAAKGQSGLLAYLALYPQEEAPAPSFDESSATNFLEADYFTQQLQYIMQLPDSVNIAKVLRPKVAGNRIASTQALHELMIDQMIPEDLGFMLEGNLDMLNHDYLGAIAAYNQALDLHYTPWPEITYNRGLAFILIDNYTNGCAELKYSASQGFKPAEEMLRSLCNF